MLPLIASLVLTSSPYPWHAGDAARRIDDIPAPVGAQRVSAPPRSYAGWLRRLPLEPEGTPVRLYDGRLKPNQRAHYAVTSLDVGERNLQQCADAAIRLFAEYSWTVRRGRGLSFHYTNGHRVPWSRWSAGHRPDVRKRGRWKVGRAGRGRGAFEGYLRNVMAYAGTASLVRHDTVPVAVDEIQAGDLLIQGGSPGHAVVVLDVAAGPNDERYLLLGQSYMPAQNFHVLKNPRSRRLSPWYRASDLTSARGLKTPEWRAFTSRDVRRIR